MDLRARIAALTGTPKKPEPPPPADKEGVRDRLRRLGVGGSPREDVPAPPVGEEEVDSGELTLVPEAELLAEWRVDADTRAATGAPAPKRRRSPPLESIPGARVVGEGDDRYLRIDRALDDEVRDGALDWLHLWEERHVLTLAPDGRLRDVDPRRALFIDTETTGLGGASSLVFLIAGVHWMDGRLHLTQFFLYGPLGERRMMADLIEFVRGFEFLVSYNGRAFDVRALCDRFIMCGLHDGPPQLEAAPHVDLLHPARRIWRHALKDCRLVTLEEEILRRPRGDDVDGMHIPMIYYSYMRTGRLREIHKVIRHNEWDTVTLALLGAALMRMLTDPSSVVEARPEHSHQRRRGEQLVGLGNLHVARGDVEQAEEALRHGLESASPSSRYFARKRLAALHKKRGEIERALPLWHAMVDENVVFEAHPFTELAKYHEHRTRDHGAAIALVQQALAMFEQRRRFDAEWDGLQQRKQRLERAMERRRPAAPR